MIVITDGRIFMDTMRLTEVLQHPKVKNITRFAIGVSVLYMSYSTYESLTYHTFKRCCVFNVHKTTFYFFYYLAPFHRLDQRY